MKAFFQHLLRLRLVSSERNCYAHSTQGNSSEEGDSDPRELVLFARVGYRGGIDSHFIPLLEESHYQEVSVH